MPSKPMVHRPPGARSSGEAKRELDRRRPSAARRGYDGRWRTARAEYLAEHRWCAHCLAGGRLTRATVVDHVRPHRGDPRLFWDRSNWAPSCKPCHDRKTVGDGRWGPRSDAEPKPRRVFGCDVHGWPLDPEHPWNR